MTKPVPTFVANLLKTRLNRYTRALDGLERGEVASLHRVRVASRRMRELVPVLRLEGSVSRKLSRKLRKVTRRLGAVRELDVLLVLIDELHVSRSTHQAALRRVRAGVAADRDNARKRLRDHLPIESLRRLGRKLSRVVARVGKKRAATPRVDSRTRAVQWAIEARVAHRAARLAAAMQGAGAVYLPERLHDVRIASKKLRYAFELLEQARRERATTPVRALRHVQGLLGRMHDLQVLIERVRETQANLPAPNLSAWHELNDLVATLEDMCRRLHARYLRERVPVEALTRRAGSSGNGSRARADRKAG